MPTSYFPFPSSFVELIVCHTSCFQYFVPQRFCIFSFFTFFFSLNVNQSFHESRIRLLNKKHKIICLLSTTQVYRCYTKKYICITTGVPKRLTRYSVCESEQLPQSLQSGSLKIFLSSKLHQYLAMIVVILKSSSMQVFAIFSFLEQLS